MEFMKDYVSGEFSYPTTRYSGSKRRLLDWIWENVKDIPFSSVLDVFGGTASTGLMFKRYGKKVHYNDLLKFNQIIATAIIENNDTKVEDSDLEAVLQGTDKDHPTFIETEFREIFFLDEENIWLDQIVANISKIENRFKRAILFASLFQACLAKRPFNLFHRANLYIRTADVKRTFGNKTTWETPFPDLLKRYVQEYNCAVFSNRRKNKVIGGFDALSTPNGVDMVYIDSPYTSSKTKSGTDYLSYYHFLEGISDYENWPKLIDLKSSTKKLDKRQDFLRFSKGDDIKSSFDSLLERFQDNILVISYLDNGIPSREDIHEKLLKLGKKVKVFEKSHKYALSKMANTELLFIAK